MTEKEYNRYFTEFNTLPEAVYGRQLVAAIRKHRDQKGDDRCWMDDEELYKVLPEGYVAPERDTTVELSNCEKFINCRRNPATQYLSPQRRIEELEEKINKYDKNISWLLDTSEDKYIVRVREGGGLEELIESLAVSFIKMRDMLMRLEEENKELKESEERWWKQSHGDRA